jgi:hypothetical protein
MAQKLAKDLPEVQAVRVDDKGRPMKGDDGEPITRTFSGQQWKLMGSDPKTNGGYEIAEGETPSEIVKTGNLTGATLRDGAGSGVDGKGKKKSKGATGNQTPDVDATSAANSNDDGNTNDDDTIDVTAKIV